MSSLARKESSGMEMTETMEESLIRETNCPAMGGKIRWKAWGV